jgi:hypothetical protein
VLLLASLVVVAALVVAVADGGSIPLRLQPRIILVLASPPGRPRWQAPCSCVG